MLACLQKMHLLVPIRFIFTNIHFLNQYSCFPNQTSHSQPIFYTRLVHVTYQISYFKEICIDISGDFSVHILTCHRHFMKCQIDFEKCTRFFKVFPYNPSINRNGPPGDIYHCSIKHHVISYCITSHLQHPEQLHICSFCCT